MTFQFDSVDAAVEQIQNGGLVIVKDREDREDEFDLIGAAISDTQERLNFMVTHGRGAYIAVFMPYGRSDSLKIGSAAQNMESHQGCKFRVSVDLVDSHSGSSAGERSDCVLALGNPESTYENFVRPGHVIPIEAVKNVLYGREGHTESGVALVMLAGVEPAVAVDLEILDTVGDMAGLEHVIALRDRFSAPEHEGKPWYEMPIVNIDLLKTAYQDAFPKPEQ